MVVTITRTPTRTVTPTNTPTRTPFVGPSPTATFCIPVSHCQPPCPTWDPHQQSGETICPQGFADVPADYPFYDDINALAERGVVSGIATTGAPLFAPQRLTTRGQLAKMIALGFGLTPYAPDHASFTDVPAQNPFYAYIEAGVREGIFSGLSERQCGATAPCFAPERPVTRIEAVVMIIRAGGWTGVHAANPDFKDVANTSFGYPELTQAIALGLVRGYRDPTACQDQGSPCFLPSRQVTRGELSHILWRAIQARP